MDNQGKKVLYHVRSITRPQVWAGSPTRYANNLQSQKPARPGYYGQSIGHDMNRSISDASWGKLMKEG